MPSLGPGVSSPGMMGPGGVAFSKKNTGLGMVAPSKRSTSAASGKNGSNSDSEVGTRRGKAKEDQANGNAAMSPGQQLLMRMYQKKAAAAVRAKGKDDEAAKAARHSPQQEKLVAEVAKRVHEAEGRRNGEYLVESDLHEICDWLASLKLPVQDYLEPLVLEGFDNMGTIRLLQEEDLIKHVGVTKTGHRKKIMFWVHRNRPEGYFDMMSDAEQEDDEQDDYNIMSELNWSSSDSSAAT